MIDSILLATDFSAASREPWPAAGALARRFGARLYVAHLEGYLARVESALRRRRAPGEEEQRRQDLRRRLEELVKGEGAFAGLPLQTALLAGGEVDSLRRFQEEKGISLILLASHGGTGLKEFLLGSFSSKVLQLATCPVLLFPSYRRRGPLGAALEPRRVLAAHDFSRPSRRALEAAREWTEAFGSRLRLLFVADPAAFAHYPGGSEAEAGAGLEKLEREAAERLAALAAERPGPAAEIRVRRGSPAAEILGEAEKWGADLIVMGSRGLSVLDRLTLGSTAERVLRAATAPVLAVKDRAESGALLAGGSP